MIKKQAVPEIWQPIPRSKPLSFPDLQIPGQSSAKPAPIETKPKPVEQDVGFAATMAIQSPFAAAPPGSDPTPVADLAPATGSASTGASFSQTRPDDDNRTMGGISIRDLGPVPSKEAEPDPYPQQITTSTMAVGNEEIEIRNIARFGTPVPGIMGSVKYWLNVRTRLKELAQEHEKSLEAYNRAAEKLRKKRVFLGRKGQEINLSGPAIDPLLSKAVRAEEDLNKAKIQHVGLEDARRQRCKELEEEIQACETEVASIMGQEKEAQGELGKIDAERRRVETEMKRHEDKLKELEELIQKKQQNYGDLTKPAEERKNLLTEITKLDRQRSGLLDRVESFEKEISSLAESVASAERRLAKIADKIQEKTKKVDDLKSQMSDIAETLSQQAGSIAQQIEEEVEQIELAWAAVGEAIIAEGFGGQDLASELNQAVIAEEAFVNQERRVGLIEIAMASYDQEAVQEAKKVVAIAAITLGVILFIVVAAIIS